MKDRLIGYLKDAHSIEEQALQQLRKAPDVAGDPQIARIFNQHIPETQRHEASVRQRLEAHGETPSKLKDVVMRAGGEGFVLFARAQLDTPGKLVAHAFSYEALEWASYELLIRVAERAADEATADAARSIRDDEDMMRKRLADVFDVAVEASLRASGTGDDLNKRLDTYLADAHALEAQAIQMLAAAPKIAAEPELARIYSEHHEESHAHQHALEALLESRGAAPSRLKDAGLRVGALNWGMFFGVQPDTAGKLAAFAYAFEHLEMAGYAQLIRVAQRAAADDVSKSAQQILEQEQAAADRIAGAFDRAVDASLPR